MDALDACAPSQVSRPRSPVLGALAMTLLGATVAVPVYYTADLRCCYPPSYRARNDAAMLRSAAELYRAMEPGACPGIGDLVREDTVPRTPDPKYDPWGTPYAIRCSGDHDVEVRSAGPDAAFGTSDDEVARRR